MPSARRCTADEEPCRWAHRHAGVPAALVEHGQQAEHIVGMAYRHRLALRQERVRAGGGRTVHRTGNHRHCPAAAPGSTYRVQAPTPRMGLHYHDHLCGRSHDPVPNGEHPPAPHSPRGHFAVENTLASDLQAQLVSFASQPQVNCIPKDAEQRRGATRGQRTAVRGRVDATGKPRHHHHASRGQAQAQINCRALPGPGRRTGAYHRHPPPVVEIAAATHTAGTSSTTNPALLAPSTSTSASYEQHRRCLGVCRQEGGISSLAKKQHFDTCGDTSGTDCLRRVRSRPGTVATRRIELMTAVAQLLPHVERARHTQHPAQHRW